MPSRLKDEDLCRESCEFPLDHGLDPFPIKAAQTASEWRDCHAHRALGFQIAVQLVETCLDVLVAP